MPIKSQQKTYHLNAPIFLVGMMGSGKSKIGQMLADYIHVAFYDSDQEIVKQKKQSVADIFATMGEKRFRALEYKTIKTIIAKKPKNKIIAGGGGAFAQKPIQQLLKKQQVATIHIDVPLGLLWHRVKNKIHQRPLLQTDKPYLALKNLYQQRRPIYAAADYQFTHQPHHLFASKKQTMLRLLALLIKNGIVKIEK